MSELVKCTAALSPDSLLTLHALETVAQHLENGIAFTYVIWIQAETTYNLISNNS